ncbi:MAG: metalloregulator ArsR/SmtB family transcription factor [Chromatiales bacterium]|nr:MAG: metalloregulator ArsR/SmtB family transcription factor [Chromatiales bacterium]
MKLDQAVLQLDAAAERSRLRLLVALLGGETTVGDLVAVLQQSQPRVSRHLRLLLEAGLLESFREGRSIYYRWSAPGLAAGVASPVAAVAASDDPTITTDRARLKALSRERERGALRRALRAGRARGLHTSDTGAAISELLHTIPGEHRSSEILIVGCGSGELLELLLPAVRMVVGTEPSGHRRQVARARLRLGGLPHWTIRDAEATQLPLASASFDLVIVQDALAPGADVAQILVEAVRVLRTAGRLLILDRILPTDMELTAHLAALGFTVTRRQWLPGREPDRALFQASRAELTPARTGTND